MTREQALQSEGKQVWSPAYEKQEIGTLVGFEWIGAAMFCKVDYCKPMPRFPQGVVPFKAKDLKLA